MRPEDVPQLLVTPFHDQVEVHVAEGGEESIRVIGWNGDAVVTDIK